MIQPIFKESHALSKRLRRKLDYIQKRFGEEELLFAYHAAFPLSLNIDLLYQIWITFQRDINGVPLNVSWISVSDILFSPLCEEIGYNLYEMNEFVRNQLLDFMRKEPRLGNTRISELAYFLLDEYEQQLDSSDLDVRDFAKTQYWTALTYTRTPDAARELSLELSTLSFEEATEWSRMTSIIQAFKFPLEEGGFRDLVEYSQGMYFWVQEELELASLTFSGLSTVDSQIKIQGIKLSIPNIKATADSSSLPVIELEKFDFYTFTDDKFRARKEAEYFSENCINGLDLRMVLIPKGELLLVDDGDGIQTEHKENLLEINSFFISKYPITQKQWELVATLPKVSIDLDSKPSVYLGPHRPVENVSYPEALEFCARLSEDANKLYRLPTETEWEYSCRAGNRQPFSFGKSLRPQWANFHTDYAFVSEILSFFSKRRDAPETTVVGFFGVANPFGLYDMHGNVWEWCATHPLSNQYGLCPVRGGSWRSPLIECTSFARRELRANYTSDDIGFRIAYSYFR